MENDKKVRGCFYHSKWNDPEPVSVLHEVFFGTGHRNISITYHLQVPVCTSIHKFMHGVDKHMWQVRACEWLGIDRDETLIAINTGRDSYLHAISHGTYLRLLGAEV